MATPRPPAITKRTAPPSAAGAGMETYEEPDENIGEFRRGKEIGKGSFATVYLAQHKKERSYAAVKAVQQGKLSKKLKENLQTEINILRSIHHPHIVALFSCTETPTFFYLVMEYCQLSDLAQFMKKRHDLAKLPETGDIFRRYPNPVPGGLNEVLCRHFLKQIGNALQYLRNNNLIHRDIKPQNLLLNPAPTFMARQRPEDKPLAASENSLSPAVGVETLPMLKIADFGFARHLPSTSLAETLCGSPLYMAPEILRYEKYDARADLWSTGTVLFEMVVGKPPFRASNHVELLRRIEKGNDQILFDRAIPISRGMKDLIRKMLRKLPLDRITYEQLFNDPVITDEIPGLVPEDQPRQTPKPKPKPEPHVSEIARRVANQTRHPAVEPRRSSEVQPRHSQDEARVVAPRTSSDYVAQQQNEGIVRRTSSSGNQTPTGTQPKDIQRQSSLKQRRPSIHTHATAPGRQEVQYSNTAPSAGARMERRPSRASPLAGPPLVREPSNAEEETVQNRRSAREAREQAAQEMVEEKEYVVIEKRSVEVNAFADEMEANANLQGRAQNQGTMVRRQTGQSIPSSITGTQPPSPSRGMVMAGRPNAMHNRTGSYERRLALPSPQTATNMLSKALNAANARLWNNLGTSPPFGAKVPSPPRGYGGFPAYPTTQGTLLIGDGTETTKAPMDEETRIVCAMEEAAHRSDVIFGFAEVKYKQLVPPTPSAQPDGLGIQRIGNTSSEPEDDKIMTPALIVEIAEEGLVLYVKTLSILAKTIDLAGHWWNKHNRGEVVSSDPSTRAGNYSASEVGRRMNNVVQWSRSRFNECLEKSEFVSRKLLKAQKELPDDHPGNPNRNTGSSSTGTAGSNLVGTSAEQIRVSSGVTAEKLMFDRAVEMSRAAAVAELLGEEIVDCEIGYATAIMMLEAVLDTDDEPLLQKSSAKKARPADEIVNGLETEDRQTVLNLIEGSRTRLNMLRKKIHAAQQTTKRSSLSGPTSRRPSNTSPATTPGLSGTPPR